MATFNKITFEATVDQDEPIAYVTLTIDGDKAGEITISKTDRHGIWAIDGVEIQPLYRGNGFYSQLITNAIYMVDGVNSLLSAERNDKSNPIYRHWMGVDVEESDEVLVTVKGEALSFELIED